MNSMLGPKNKCTDCKRFFTIMYFFGVGHQCHVLSFMSLNTENVFTIYVYSLFHFAKTIIEILLIIMLHHYFYFLNTTNLYGYLSNRMCSVHYAIELCQLFFTFIITTMSRNDIIMLMIELQFTVEYASIICSNLQF